MHTLMALYYTQMVHTHEGTMAHANGTIAREWLWCIQMGNANDTMAHVNGLRYIQMGNANGLHS